MTPQKRQRKLIKALEKLGFSVLKYETDISKEINGGFIVDIKIANTFKNVCKKKN